MNVKTTQGSDNEGGGPSEYPGVALAYDLACNSFDWANRRLEAVEGRAQSVLTFASTVTIAVIPLAVTRGLPARSAWLWLALAAFVAGVALATVARVRGRLHLISPALLFEKWLHKDDWEFKKDMIFFAGESFEANRAMVGMKHRLTIVATVMFAVEAVLVVVWASVVLHG